MDCERVVALIVAHLFLISVICKAQRLRFLALNLVYERRQCALINALLMTRIKSYKSEEEGGEELKQDGGEWHECVQDCKNGLKKCIEIWSCFCHGKMTKVQSRKNPLELTESQKILVREGGRKHMYIVGVR